MLLVLFVVLVRKETLYNIDLGGKEFDLEFFSSRGK